MKYSEQPVAFDCEREALMGVLAIPLGPVAAVGVIIIVGGPQYRAGSHRQFVLLSRAVAAAGFLALRFDYRGMGDSTGEPRDFLQVTPDVASAIDAMQRHAPLVQKVVLWGLCDGASAALLYYHDTRDPRIIGLCLLNPWVRSATSLARAHVKHYYADRLRQKEFWIKLISGKVAGAALAGLWHNLVLAVHRSDHSKTSAATPFQNRMAIAWRNFGGSTLVLLSDGDYTAREFTDFTKTQPAWAGLFDRPSVSQALVADADHTFSSNHARAKVESLSLQWLQKIANRT